MTGGQGIQDDHVFPRKWAGWPDNVAPDDRNNIANIAAITQYTNDWKSKKPRDKFVTELIDLGIPEHRLRNIFEGHLIDLDDLRSNDWTAFLSRRKAAIHTMLLEHFASGEGSHVADPVPTL
jgi:hypothetical protein